MGHRLLHPVLAEPPVARRNSRLEARRGLKLGHRDQSHRIAAAASVGRCTIDPSADFGKAAGHGLGADVFHVVAHRFNLSRRGCVAILATVWVRPSGFVDAAQMGYCVLQVTVWCFCGFYATLPLSVLVNGHKGHHVRGAQGTGGLLSVGFVAWGELRPRVKKPA